MLNKVDNVFIGKYIERTAAVADGATMTVAQSNAVEGEVFILDTDYNVIEGSSATYTNAKSIIIAEGSAEVFSTYNPDGTTLTGRRLLLSSPIDGAHVVNYGGGAYSAKSEAVATLPAISAPVSPS